MRMALTCLVCACVACGDTATRPPLILDGHHETAKHVPAPPPAPRDDGRLPPLATPLRYAIELDVDPRKDTFAGVVRVLVDVVAPTEYVVLNGRDIRVQRATAQIESRSLVAHVTTRASRGTLNPDEIVLQWDEALPRGHATIDIAYDAPFGRTLTGLYRTIDGGKPYAFTQFEVADARRAFPCFDEPAFKTPYDVSINSPSSMVAISNGPEKARVPNGNTTTFRFATTAPIPSYLVAFAVGEFDIKEAIKTKVPIRVITTQGRLAFADTLLRTASELLPLLGEYFGIAYPYEKLDLVAVPDFAAGGMENAGIITFRDDAVLLDERASLRAVRSMTSLVAHELAHQWFGDLVTMQWWDDTWLNEGFATWMTYKVVEKYKPSYGFAIDAAQSASYIMDQDGLASARAIRQPVASIGQAMEAFDGITYQKGAAVLRMLERYVGEEGFQRGVEKYLRAHAWGNATADDFLKALDEGSGKKASDIARAFFDKPGVPLVVFDSLRCDAKGFQGEVHAERFAPIGASLPPEVPWTVPLCAQNAGHALPCIALHDRASISGAGACPVVGNPDGVGYYRVAWQKAELAALMARFASFDVPTRASILADAWAQTRAGKLDAMTLLEKVLPAVDGERDRHVIEQLVGILSALSELVDDTTLPTYASYVRARLGPHLARVSAQHDDDARLLRRSLVAALVDLGQDTALLARVTADAKRFAQDPKAIDADYAQVAVELAARSSTAADLQRAVREAKTPQDHLLALRGAGGVVDPAAVKAQLDWMLSSEVKLQDVRAILWPLVGRRATRKLALAYARDHWDALTAKLPGALGRGLVYLSGYVCTEAELEASRVFYTEKATRLEGSQRPLAQALEGAGICVAQRARILPDVKKALPTSSAAAVPAHR